MMRDTPGSQWLAAVEPLQPEDVAAPLSLHVPTGLSIGQ